MNKSLPKHVAVIMDGNGRWATEKGLPRIAGHRQGVERVKEIIKTASELGIEVLTLFAFSAENWSRPKQEIAMLMRYLDDFLKHYIADLDKNNIRFRVIGASEPLPKNILSKIKKSQEDTAENTGMTLVLALNYGSRQELIAAAKNFARDVLDSKITVDGLDMDKFSDYLQTAGLVDPDLLIRTSGEMRLSNFLLWQLSYAELYFARKYWPDFKKVDFLKAVSEFQRRERRFGDVK